MSAKPFISLSKKTFIAVIAFLMAIILWLILPFIGSGPVQYSNIDEHFKYGSIGGENTDGIPYWIIKVLPEVFSDKLDGEGFGHFGFIQEPNHELPIGFSKSSNSLLLGLGVDVVTQNCATCHVGLLRKAKSDPPEIISTMPGITINLQGFIQFLTEAAADERFSASHLMPYINEAGANFNPLEKLVYRFIVIPRTRDELLIQRHDFDFMKQQSVYGPGRVDTFNSYKQRRYGFPADKWTPEERNGISDYPSIWNQAPRVDMKLHWDGNNNDSSERNRTAALAVVAPTTIDLDSMERIRNWLMDIKAPKYRDRFPINQALATQGKPIFKNNCASCHAIDGDKIGEITPIEEVQTDRGRLDSYTYDLASNQNLTFSGIRYKGIDQRFSHFKKTNGYTNGLLDGVWLRSPYLHNGSVPTLRDLLNKPEDRPQSFYRGYDVFNQKDVGYISDVSEEDGRSFFKYDTNLPSNSNSGHLYGTELNSDEKEALLEYLKTL